jgi:hypothetical protein
MAKGTQLDVGPYTTAVNSLRRLLSDLGLQRIAKDATMTPAQYAAKLRSQREIDAEAGDE